MDCSVFRAVLKVYMVQGQTPHRALIANITNSVQCEIETQEDHGYNTGDTVRITDLGYSMLIARNFEPLDNYEFLVEKVDDTHFKIKNVITREYIDSTNFGAYVTGGRVNLESQSFVYNPPEDE